MIRSTKSRVLIATAGLAAVLAGVFFRSRDDASPKPAARPVKIAAYPQWRTAPRVINSGILNVWWDPLPAALRNRVFQRDGHSNIHPDDYVGPEACGKCHRKNYDLWSRHPHRWMNALATEETVRGDFSSDASVSYLDGTAQFSRDGDRNRMQLERDGVRRIYEVTQTIGSRFFQYYVGKLIEGPEADDHDSWQVDHVLPFGYWLDRREWLPIVHVHDDVKKLDGLRSDPFDARPGSLAFRPYYRCNACHATFALADNYLRKIFPDPGHNPPVNLHFSMSDFLAEARPQIWANGQHPAELSSDGLEQLSQQIWKFEAPEHAVTLGISCEACHLGGREHALGHLKKPGFHPVSRHLVLDSKAPPESDPRQASGRSHASLNWNCGRCHAGDRPQFAAGMTTWNSTEYTDAMRGSCYTQLKCIDCHNPHEGIGPMWTHTPQQDDDACLKCHQHLDESAARTAHTHHPIDSEGSQCMNCHMPRLNEGLQDVVRTHMIFSPTNRKTIETNHPNACNQCHTDQPIDWTIKHLRDWYKSDFTESKVAEHYPDRTKPAAVGWLNSSNQAVRLVGVDSLTRRKDRAALPQLIDALDDPHLLNRQFARIGLEQMLDVHLVDFGYQFYMTPTERREPIQRIRDALLSTDAEDR